MGWEGGGAGIDRRSRWERERVAIDRRGVGEGETGELGGGESGDRVEVGIDRGDAWCNG